MPYGSPSSVRCLRSNCGQGEQNAIQSELRVRKNPRICRTFKSALGRTRTCDLLIRSWFARVRIRPNVSEDLAYLCRLSHFIATLFSSLFSSVLARLQYGCSTASGPREAAGGVCTVSNASFHKSAVGAGSRCRDQPMSLPASPILIDASARSQYARMGAQWPNNPVRLTYI